MSFTFKVTEYGPTPVRLASAHRRLNMGALIDTGDFWVKNFARIHFTKRGAHRYGYKKRKGMEFARGTKEWRDSYSGNKLRTKGHMRPLFFSGDTRKEALAARALPFKGMARVVLPRGLNRRHPESEINMREEMTTVIPSEEEALARVFARSYERRLVELRGKGARQIGAKAVAKAAEGKTFRFGRTIK